MTLTLICLISLSAFATDPYVPVNPPSPVISYDPWFAGVMLGFQLIQTPMTKDDEKHPRVYGSCQTKHPDQKRPERSCAGTYILARVLKANTEFHVWVDDEGKFGFPYNGQKLGASKLKT
jgi:hypothetical protein